MFKWLIIKNIIYSNNIMQNKETQTEIIKRGRKKKIQLAKQKHISDAEPVIRTY